MAYDITRAQVKLELEYWGSDWLVFDITETIKSDFAHLNIYSGEFKYVFYPSFTSGEIGLLYYFDPNIDRSVGKTTYIGWGTIDSKAKKSETEYHFFDKDEYTNSYDEAEALMIVQIYLMQLKLKRGK